MFPVLTIYNFVCLRNLVPQIKNDFLTECEIIAIFEICVNVLL